MAPETSTFVEAAVVAAQGSPAAIDLPEGARCFRCGYQLRALTLARCPECGHAFNVQDYPYPKGAAAPMGRAEAYLPAWPILLGLYFAAAAARLVAVCIDFTIRGYQVGFGQIPNLALEEEFTRLILCTAAAYGFLRRRTWAVYVALVFAFLPFVVFAVAQCIHSLFGHVHFNLATVFAYVCKLPVLVISVGIAVFLRTGMRRFSLSDVQQDRWPVYAADRAIPRRDWMPLLILIALNKFLYEVAAVGYWLYLVGHQKLLAAQREELILGMSLFAMMIVADSLVAVLLWRSWRWAGVILAVWAALFCVQDLTTSFAGVYIFSNNPVKHFPYWMVVFNIVNTLRYAVLVVFVRYTRKREREGSLPCS